jgi:VWFA-related protein
MSLRKSVVRPIFFFLAAVAFLGASAFQGAYAQQTSNAPSNSAAKASSQQVVLAVMVRDKKGALVPNVQQGDLTLTQDGRPQTILSLSRNAADQPLRIGLLVDTSRSMGGAMEAVRKAAGSFVDQALPAEGSGKDQAFLLHFDREVELLEDFTSSRDQLHEEIEGMGSTSARHDDRGGPETTGDDRTPTTNTRATDQLYDAIYLAADELMKDKNGRKVLVIFSTGGDHGSK